MSACDRYANGQTSGRTPQEKKSRKSSDKEGRAFNTGDMSEEHRESQAYVFKDEMLKCTIYHQFLDGGSLFTFSTLLELNPSYT